MMQNNLCVYSPKMKLGNMFASQCAEHSVVLRVCMLVTQIGIADTALPGLIWMMNL